MPWRRPHPDPRDDRPLGGVIHSYQSFDPKNFPSPTAPPPDVVSPAFEHLLTYGSMRRLSEEELARAVRLDPSQIAGLGPSIDALIAMLEERKRKILATYETKTVLERAARAYRARTDEADPPDALRPSFEKEAAAEHLRGLERLWYRAGDDQSPFARHLVHIIESLGEKYQVESLAAAYAFTGRTQLTVPEALEVKETLETIERLLEQLRKARENAQLAVVDMEALSQFAQEADVEQLRAMQQQVQDYLNEMAGRQGLQFTRDGYQLTPKAMRIFQSRILEQIFGDLQAARSGRHTGPISGDGAIEMPRTKPYEFGDSVTHMDITQTLVNAMIRGGPGLPIDVHSDDIEIHRTRNNPKCATVVIMDMSGSMRYDGQYVNAKRMALALDGLIRSEYPGDFIRFVEMYSFAKVRPIAEVPTLMPKPVTVYDPIVRLTADMSDEAISELDIPPHFTNIQHALQVSRQLLMGQDTPNKQIVLITDGLPTAHFEGEHLYLLYPPDPRTEVATMREAARCVREQITINVFCLPNWAQTDADVQFAHRMVEATGGRVFFTGGRDLDRYVVWDYVANRRKIVG
jgi:uncharacterized protein with von Willebrand factor type A (vWA) domain